MTTNRDKARTLARNVGLTTNSRAIEDAIASALNEAERRGAERAYEEAAGIVQREGKAIWAVAHARLMGLAQKTRTS